MTNTHWTISVVIITVVGLALWLKYWLTKPATLNTGTGGNNGGGNASPVQATNRKSGVTIEISSITFSLVVTLSICIAIFTSLPFVISFTGGEGFKLSKFQTFALEFSIPTLIILGYFHFWKKPTKEKVTDINKGFEIPDKHVGILQFLGMPVKFLVLSEGQLWLPWGFSVSMKNVALQNRRIPETADKPGFKVTTKSGEEALVSIGFLGGPDKRQLYKALFGLNEGAAEESSTQTFIAQTRTFCSMFDIRDLTNPSSAVRRILLNGTAGYADGKTEKIKVIDSDDEQDLSMEGILPYALKICREELAYVVDPKSVQIISITYANAKAQEAREEEARIMNTERALGRQRESYLEQIKKLETEGGFTHEEAVQQIRLDRKQMELKEVRLTGSKADDAKPFVNT